MSVVDFRKPLWKENLDEESEETGFTGTMIEYIQSLAQEINSFDEEEEGESIDQSIARYQKMVSTKLPTKHILRLNNYVPLRIPKLDKTIYTVPKMALSLLTKLKKPFFLLDYIRNEIFHYFTEEIREGLTYSPVIACSMIETSKKIDGIIQYAVLTIEKKFYHIKLCEDKDEADKFPCVDINSVTIDEKKQVVALKFNETLLFSFKPKDPSHLNLWKQIPKNPNLSYVFFGSIGKIYPNTINLAFYIAITSPDLYFLKTFIKITKTSKPLLKIFEYRNRVESFIANVVGLEFSEEMPGLTKDLLEEILKSYGSKYNNNFLRKLNEYIDTKGEILGEKAIFTILKYICNSANLIPQEVRIVFYLYNRYLTLVSQGNVNAVFKGMLYLYFGVILIPNIKPIVAKQLVQVMSMKSDFNKRMEKKGIKMLTKFFNNLILCNYNYQCKWRVPTIEQVTESTKWALETLNGHGPEILQTFMKFADTTSTKPTQISWMYCSFLLDNFGYKDELADLASIDLSDLYDPEKITPTQFEEIANDNDNENAKDDVDLLTDFSKPKKQTIKDEEKQENAELKPEITEQKPENTEQKQQEVKEEKTDNENVDSPKIDAQNHELKQEDIDIFAQLNQMSGYANETPQKSKENQQENIQEKTENSQPKENQNQIQEKPVNVENETSKPATNEVQSQKNEIINEKPVETTPVKQEISHQSDQKIVETKKDENHEEKKMPGSPYSPVKAKLSIQFATDVVHQFLRISDLFVFIDNPDPDMPAPKPKKPARRGRRAAKRAATVDPSSQQLSTESPAPKSPRRRGRKRGKSKTVEGSTPQSIVQTPSASPKKKKGRKGKKGKSAAVEL